MKIETLKYFLKIQSTYVLNILQNLTKLNKINFFTKNIFRN